MTGKFYVGQKVVITGANRREPSEGVVTKIGRKLVTVREGSWREKQYRIEDGVRNDAYGHDAILTQEEFAEKIERIHIFKKLEAMMWLRNMGRYSVDQLRRIVAIMEEGEEN